MHSAKISRAGLLACASMALAGAFAASPAATNAPAASAAAAKPAATNAPAAVRWYPAQGWRETPDPAASPRAKKGGSITFNGSSPPKSFNAYIDNNSYSSMMFSMMYDALVATDPNTMDFVPALANRWCVSADGREFTFYIDERARWSDGLPVTADDVKWTFDIVTASKSETGSWKMILSAFDSPEIVDAGSERPRVVRFRKKGDSPRDWRDVMHCGTFWVLPKHAFERFDFNKLDFLNAVVGGPYRISHVAEQVETEYSRVRDWWRVDTPSCRGLYNFDKIVLRYYIDNSNAFDALKKGIVDVYPVYMARIWANDTKGPKFFKNWIVKRKVFNHRPVGFQCFAMNMRRWPFDDIRVRQAMAKLIDREMFNRTMMFNEYYMQNSFYRDVYDDEHPCDNPLILYDPPGAAKLLEEAGFRKNESTGLLEKDGRPFSFQFLSRNASEDRFLVHFNTALKSLGITMSVTRKDFANWMRDMDDFNFDMTWQSWGGVMFKTPETMWLSSEADRKQSNNTMGFKSAEVDRLINEEKAMETFAERAAAYREIDRLIARESPCAFLWNTSSTRLLYWNKFGMPDAAFSRYNDEEGVLFYWWYDEDKARELDAAMSAGGFLPSVPENVDYDEVMRAKARK